MRLLVQKGPGGCSLWNIQVDVNLNRVLPNHNVNSSRDIIDCAGDLPKILEVRLSSTLSDFR